MEASNKKSWSWTKALKREVGPNRYWYYIRALRFEQGIRIGDVG